MFLSKGANMIFKTEAYEVSFEKETKLDLNSIFERLHKKFKFNVVENYVSFDLFLDEKTSCMMKIYYTKKEEMYYYTIEYIDEFETSELIYKKSKDCKSPDCIIQYINNYVKHYNKTLQKSATTFIAKLIVYTNENCEIEDVSEDYFKI